MTAADKALVTLGGVPLAGTQGVGWQLIPGVLPYTATFAVHESSWPKLESQIGKPLTLSITDGRGITTDVEKLYILHVAPSDSPHRVDFVVADKRWKWPYTLVVRDFNMPRKTGDRTAFESVPVETQVVVDKYDYLPYSLDGELKWTAKGAVIEVLKLLEPDEEGPRGSTVQHSRVDSFPIPDTTERGTGGQFTLQGITLRDSGDVALSRLLSYIPGAEVYIDTKGVAVIFDGTDLDEADKYFRTLPVSTYTGEHAVYVDRAMIRPTKIVAHYQREVECVFDFSDDYSGGTRATPSRSAPYIENVMPTVDPVTTITETDPETGASQPKSVRAGTWVRVDVWLDAMDKTRPADSLPWTFDTIKRHWLKGDLEGVLGARGLDLDPTADVAARVGALRRHFRQTFRVNRRYMERVRALIPQRVALLDPVTGARAPAAVWGQACIVPSTKGKLMACRTADPDKTKVFRNVDYLATSQGGAQLIATTPGPAAVEMNDADLGVFRVEWLASPYGDVDSFLPCNLVDELNGGRQVITRDLSKQDVLPMGASMKVESGTNGIFLSPSLRLKVLMTVVPAAPNNEKQFHRVEVDAADVADLFAAEFRIRNGDGPELHVFVPPGEATARFAWTTDNAATSTVQDLLGLREDDPKKAGLDGPDLPGFTLCNEARHLSDHSISLAAELLAGFADGVQGQVVTRSPDKGDLKIVGNMGGAMIRVGAAPSAKVDAVHRFPGQQRPISRMALLPEAARQIVLGLIPFK